MTSTAEAALYDEYGSLFGRAKAGVQVVKYGILERIAKSIIERVNFPEDGILGTFVGRPARHG